MQAINERQRGFFTIAQNTETVDYVRLAYGLALSLRKSQSQVPYLSIGITPGTSVDPRYSWAFDNVIEIPWGDHAESSQWKLENEWKSIWMTPYQETIKLDCDMLFLSDVHHWWGALSQGPDDVRWTNTVLDWRGFPATSDHYRKTFTENNLPNIYTGCGYFRKTPEAFELFELAKVIYWNWERFFEEFLQSLHRPTHPSTDVIFALAMKLLDLDQTSYTPQPFPTFVHMKSYLQGWTGTVSEDWRDHLRVFFTPSAECKIGNHQQYYPLHYHIKEFLTDEILLTYERLVMHG